MGERARVRVRDLSLTVGKPDMVAVSGGHTQIIWSTDTTEVLLSMSAKAARRLRDMLSAGFDREPRTESTAGV